MIFNLYKKRGETPLECLNRFKQTQENTQDKWTYMGRLDPMAEGVLLVANGEDVKRKEEFLGLDKDYEFSAIFGFRTDSYDVLGKITPPLAPPQRGRGKNTTDISELDLIKICKIYEGEREQKYPFYSSKMIAMRKNQNPKKDSLEQPGYFSAEKSPPSPASRSPRVVLKNFSFGSDFLNESEVKKITIHKLQFHKLENFSNKELFGRILMDISKVKGDFRQAEILDLWKNILLDASDRGSYLVAKFSATVSSGTYIRSLVNDMGNTLGCGATTLSIKRTRVGDFKIEDSIK